MHVYNIYIYIYMYIYIYREREMYVYKHMLMRRQVSDRFREAPRGSA